MSRHIFAGCAAVAVVSCGLVPGAQSTAVTARATVRPNPRTMYLAATRSRGMGRLQLVDRATGATLATLATRPLVKAYDRLNSPFEDATIGPDGTVWAVQWTGGRYGYSLLRIKNGRTNTFLQHVHAARVSPDGKRIAVTTMAPDTDRDGKGTLAVRVGSTAGGTLRPLYAETFPVAKDGTPTTNYLLPLVQTWLGNHHLAVGYGCCDDGNVSVISADKASRRAAWPVVNGNADTEVAAKIGDATALVPVRTGYRRSDGTWVETGFDIRKVSPAVPRGTKVAHTGDIKRYVATTKATPVLSTYATLRYRKIAGVTLDWNFLGR